jgi:hypothetical protein
MPLLAEVIAYNQRLVDREASAGEPQEANAGKVA